MGGLYVHVLSVIIARQEKENQERNKDPGKSEGWPKYYLTVRYCQGSCGNLFIYCSLETFTNVYVYVCNHSIFFCPF